MSLSNVLERCVAPWVMAATEDTLNKNQFVSVSGSSTVYAMTELVHQWQEVLNLPGRRVRLLLLDYSKSFDYIDHILFLQKIANPGIPDFLLR